MEARTGVVLGPGLLCCCNELLICNAGASVGGRANLVPEQMHRSELGSHRQHLTPDFRSASIGINTQLNLCLESAQSPLRNRVFSDKFSDRKMCCMSVF